MTRVRWMTGDRLTPIHAARCFAQGHRGIDASLADAMDGPMRELSERLAGADLDISLFWNRLMSSVAAGDGDLPACVDALLAAGCSPLAIDQTAAAVTSRLADIRLAHHERYPKLSEQLPLRGRPLREQWDGYGSGLMKRIGQLTHASLVPKAATCLLLAPYRGGDGGLDASAQRLWIEAVLTNPVPDLPEVLRLAWLLGQLGMIEGLSSGAEDSQGDPWVLPARLPRVVMLAMLPIVLEAGFYLELIPSAPSEMATMIPKAARAWRAPLQVQDAAAIGDWWRQCQSLQPPPPVALKALDRMLHPESTPQTGNRR